MNFYNGPIIGGSINRDGPRKISERLSEVSRKTFVGRQSELSLLSDAIHAEKQPFFVAFIHGPGGIGKSRLINALLSNVNPEIRRLVLDCREIEPTPQGFLGALGAALGMHDIEASFVQIINRLGEIGQRTLLTLDTYETFGLLDTWLRQKFVPSLTENFFTIIAGRDAPNLAWITSPGWQGLFREIELGELPESDAQKMLEFRDLTHDQIRRIQHLVKGYPLALEMAASAIHHQPDLELSNVPSSKIFQKFTQTFLSGLPSEIRIAAEASSTVRRVTEPLLKSLLNRSDVREIFNNLLNLPFIDATPEGFICQDVVRDTISKNLSLRDPDRYHTYRKRAYSYFTRESHRAVANTLWQYTADLLYMIENPIAKGAFFPEGATVLRVEPATPRHAYNIHEITSAKEPSEASKIIELWWRHHPETFNIVKTSDGKIQAFYIIFEADKISRSVLEKDPFTRVWLNHLSANPVEIEERVLFCRRWLDRTTGELPSPAVSACFLDVKRLYMELRPSLRRIYFPVKDSSIFEPLLFPLGFTSIESAQVNSDGIKYHTLMNDFGPSSVDGWLAKIVGQELGVDFATTQGRALVIVLFTDIVNSTEKAISLGDAHWKDLLENHHKLVRIELARFQGREIDTAGDGFFAIFEKPVKAIQCASAIRAAVSKIGINIRAGLHLGECDVMTDSVRGITVHIGARVAAKSEIGEILVSSTLKDVVAGSDFRFEDRGSHELKGIPGTWNLYSVKKDQTLAQ